MPKTIERHIRIGADTHPLIFAHLDQFGPKALTREMVLLMEFGLMVRQRGVNLGNLLAPKAELSSEPEKQEPLVKPVHGMEDDFDISDAFFDARE
ncbi:hypothetical protein ACROAH_15370 [Shewanella oncorhynchi]|uniref:hypothetical protein n=1 Tax=Shewanella TaxID=22 RepID=UPI0039AEF50F